MAVQVTSRFKVQPISEPWLVHALVAEVVDRLREQPGVEQAFVLWPTPTSLAVHARHRGDLFERADELMVVFENALTRILTGHAHLGTSGTELLAA